MATPAHDAPPRVIRGNRRISAPAAAVWEHLRDPRRLAALNPDSLGLDGIRPAGPLQPGQRWVERAHGPLGALELAARVEEADPEAGIIRIRSEGPLGVRVESLLRLRPDGEGREAATAVTFEHRLRLPAGPMHAAVAAVVAARVQEGTREALQRLARAVEAPGAGPPAPESVSPPG